ncbi:Nephrocystin-4 [Phlyctochytrium planicorne]|nr:Nephrocystin-4 [Phlyctochytrium planicorne]
MDGFSSGRNSMRNSRSFSAREKSRSFSQTNNSASVRANSALSIDIPTSKEFHHNNNNNSINGKHGHRHNHDDDSHKGHDHDHGDHEHEHEDEEEHAFLTPEALTFGWLARYQHNSFILPPVFNSNSKPQRKLSSPLATATVESADRTVNSQLLVPPSFRFPYSLAFHKILSLPLPLDISDEYLASDLPLNLQLRVSLFDLESNAFFGRTWVDPMQYDLRSMGDEQLRWDEEFTGGATRSLGGSEYSEDSDDYDSEEDDSEDYSEDDDEEEEEDEEGYSETESGESSDVDAKSNNRNRGLFKKKNSASASPKAKKPPKAKKKKKSKSKKAPFLETDEDPIKITGHRLTVDLAERTIWMHTNRTSDLIIAVIDDEPDQISCGWTFFPLFHTEGGGIDPFETWTAVDGDPINNPISDFLEQTTTLPVYIGSPRSLLFISPYLKENIQGYPLLIPIPSATVQFNFSPRPELRPVTMLWQENVWISAEDDIPGIGSFEVDENQDEEGSEEAESPGKKIRVLSENVTLSRITLTIYPSLRKFEEHFLSSFLTSLTTTYPSPPPPSPPRILDRRLHIGFHNTQVFLSPPIPLTLHPQYLDSLGGDAFHLGFNGQVHLEGYLRDEGVAVVGVMEYKVGVQVWEEKARGGLAGFVERITGGGEESTWKEMERTVTVGWFVWVPSGFDQQNPVFVNLLTHTPMNPYSTLCLIPNIPDLMESSHLDHLAHQFGRVATPDNPICLSFDFNFQDEPPLPSPLRASPTAERSLTPRQVQFPAEEEYDEEVVDQKPTPQAKRSPTPTKSRPKSPALDMDDSDDLTPTPLPPLPRMAPTPTSQKPLISRSERARIAKAGFGGFVDAKGEKPFIVNAQGRERANAKTNVGLERGDSRSVNEVTVQILGITFLEDGPSSVYITFDFYQFGSIVSEKACVYTGPLPIPREGSNHADNNHHRSQSVPIKQHDRQWSHHSAQSYHSAPSDAKEWPGILYPIDDNGGLLGTLVPRCIIVSYRTLNQNVTDKHPGISRTFEVDTEKDIVVSLNACRSNLPPFIHYLNSTSLSVDIWDGDSMIYVGNAVLELRHCLRQGQGGVIAEYDVDIILPEETVQIPFDKVMGETMTRVVGRLHARIVNIGKSEMKGELEERGLVKRKISHFEKSGVVVRDFRVMTSGKMEVIVDPRKMSDVDPELSDLLRMTYEDRRSRLIQSPNHLSDPKDALLSLRRVDRVKAFLRSSKDGNGKVEEENFSYRLTRQDRQRDLETISIFRERKRPDLIERALTKSMTTTYSVTIGYGGARFFEFVFTNPYDEEHLFEVSWIDDELRVIQSSAEWRYLRKLHGITGGIEDSLFSSTPDGTPSILLQPNETISVPFVFQSFVEPPTHAYRFNNPESSLMHDDSMASIEHRSRVIKVAILNQKRSPVSLLNVSISMIEVVVDKTFRFFRPEGETIRQRIRGSIGASEADKESEINPVFEASAPYQRYVRFSQPDVICTVDEETKNKKTKEISLKYRSGTAMDVQTAYILFYFDPYLTALAEVWRIYIHPVHRMDVTSVVGQTNVFSLVVRGSSFTRIVQGFSNNPGDLSVATKAPFSLIANALNEVGIHLRMKDMKDQAYLFNLFDSERRSLVSSWMIVSHFTSPSVTKSFEISLPKGKSVNKRVSYSNPYQTRKTFFLRTNAPDLLQFRDGGNFEMEPGASQYLAFRFLPVQNCVSREVLVFLNDENDRMEECLRIGIKYKQ